MLEVNSGPEEQPVLLTADALIIPPALLCILVNAGEGEASLSYPAPPRVVGLLSLFSYDSGGVVCFSYVLVLS